MTKRLSRLPLPMRKGGGGGRTARPGLGLPRDWPDCTAAPHHAAPQTPPARHDGAGREVTPSIDGHVRTRHAACAAQSRRRHFKNGAACPRPMSGARLGSTSGPGCMRASGRVNILLGGGRGPWRPPPNSGEGGLRKGAPRATRSFPQYKCLKIFGSNLPMGVLERPATVGIAPRPPPPPHSKRRTFPSPLEPVLQSAEIFR